MLYGVIFALLALIGAQQYLHDQERRRWEAERQNLLTRIQAPDVAHAKAIRELNGADERAMSERQRLERKAEELGLTVDQMRTPPGWGSYKL